MRAPGTVQTSLGTRVALRTFVVFGLTSALPVVLFAVIGWFFVSDELERAAHARLEEASKRYGLALNERLIQAETLMIEAARIQLETPDTDAGNSSLLNRMQILTPLMEQDAPIAPREVLPSEVRLPEGWTATRALQADVSGGVGRVRLHVNVTDGTRSVEPHRRSHRSRVLGHRAGAAEWSRLRVRRRQAPPLRHRRRLAARRARFRRRGMGAVPEAPLRRGFVDGARRAAAQHRARVRAVVQDHAADHRRHRDRRRAAAELHAPAAHPCAARAPGRRREAHESRALRRAAADRRRRRVRQRRPRIQSPRRSTQAPAGPAVDAGAHRPPDPRAPDVRAGGADAAASHTAADRLSGGGGDAGLRQRRERGSCCCIARDRDWAWRSRAWKRAMVPPTRCAARAARSWSGCRSPSTSKVSSAACCSPAIRRISRRVPPPGARCAASRIDWRSRSATRTVNARSSSRRTSIR